MSADVSPLATTIPPPMGSSEPAVAVPVEMTWCEICDADVDRAQAVRLVDGTSICEPCWSERPTEEMTVWPGGEA